MVLALQSHSSRYALKMSMSGPGFKPQGHLCLERMGRRLASTIKCFENWQRCSNFVIFYQIHSPPCNTKWCIFNYMQTCWINFSYGHDMLHDSGTWVASVAQTWHVCVCVCDALHLARIQSMPASFGIPLFCWKVPCIFGHTDADELFLSFGLCHTCTCGGDAPPYDFVYF